MLRLTALLVALILIGSCTSKDKTQEQSEALIRNLITVEGWINSYQLKRKPGASMEQEKPIYPRLKDLQDLLMQSKQVRSLSEPPLKNPVSGLAEWPIESPKSVKDYRRLLSDKESQVGAGSIEYIPFVESGAVIGYALRAGDPVSGKVFCTNGNPCLRSSP